jgi:hypothetical protein
MREYSERDRKSHILAPHGIASQLLQVTISFGYSATNARFWAQKRVATDSMAYRASHNGSPNHFRDSDPPREPRAMKRNQDGRDNYVGSKRMKTEEAIKRDTAYARGTTYWDGNDHGWKVNAPLQGGL